MITDEERLRELSADDIVVIRHGESGESASTHHDWSSEDVVYTRAGKSFRSTIHCSHDVFRGTKTWQEGEQEISAAEYARLAAGHTPQNVPATRAQIAHRNAAIAAEEAARPNCPKCGKKMIMRTGNFPSFWGCSDYPKSGCKGRR